MSQCGEIGKHVFKKNAASAINIYMYKGIEWDNKVIEAAKNSLSAHEAMQKLGCKYSTYKKHAERLGVWFTNQSGKGTSKTKKTRLTSKDVFSGRAMQTGQVKRILLRENIINNECEICGVNEWQGKELTCHLDHINGDCHDHRLDNLRMLCPNCHSQTETYAGKNSRSDIIKE